ncbi:MAG TPA: dethiobiotin synthase [Pseudomonadales bacterium]|nr:dethiobiotin synthase [Pseudomonadales bacterium]
MKEIVFIAGTDTGVGKTHIACQLLRAAQQQGLRTLGLKPLAAGAEKIDDEWRNEDAVLLQQVATAKLPYTNINPFCFALPVAPHLAAKKTGTSLSAKTIAQHVRNVLDETDFDYAVIEGAGGWRVPLNETETFADVVKLLQVPVILVVGMKLGCINHALLTAEAIKTDGVTLQGWIANDLGNSMSLLEENIATLENLLPAPRIRI